MKDKSIPWICAASLALLVAPVTVEGQSVIAEPHVMLRAAGKGQKSFDVTRHTVPLAEILDGGPPRNGIPTLVDPIFVPADQMRRLLKDNDRVLGVVVNGEAKAYPLRILNWHELVNDSVGGRAVLVSW